MKKAPLTCYALLLLLAACGQPVDKEKVKAEVMAVEQAFEQMAAEKGIAVAFAHFAAADAVIKREHDTLIHGPEGIRHYYSKPNMLRAKVTWTPEHVEVAEDGSMASTYGQYLWTMPADSGAPVEFSGVFHTVWKRQASGEWKYVWD